ncbi:MAG: hypothetical protein KatS3mg100_510 [Candidatus Parcubacteria bacterium]|nr:MAG: hypothetical protein KatS3mg100_510 [Candidatus Parcubacteria bacterium]
MRRHHTLHHNRTEKWYEDKQNLALVLGFISTIVTLLNAFVERG